MSRYRKTLVRLERNNYGDSIEWYFDWLLPGDKAKAGIYYKVSCRKQSFVGFPTRKAALEYARSQGWEEIRI